MRCVASSIPLNSSQHKHMFTLFTLSSQVFSLGVWKDVYIVPVAPNAAAITHVVPAVTYTGEYPVEPLTDATAAPFRVDVTVHTRALKTTKAVLTATGEWDPAHPVSTTVDIPAGEGKVRVRLNARGVKLWWPNGFGEQVSTAVLGYWVGVRRLLHNIIPCRDPLGFTPSSWY